MINNLINEMKVFQTGGSILLFDVFLSLTEEDSITATGRTVFVVKNCIGKDDSYRVVLLHRDEVSTERSSWNYCVAVTPDSVLLSDQLMSVVESMMLFEAMYRIRQNAIEGTKYIRKSNAKLTNIEIRLSETHGCIYMCDYDQEVISEEIPDE